MRRRAGRDRGPTRRSTWRSGGRRRQRLHRRRDRQKDPQGDPSRGDLDPGRRRHLMLGADLELRRRAGRDRGPVRHSAWRGGGRRRQRLHRRPWKPQDPQGHPGRGDLHDCGRRDLLRGPDRELRRWAERKGGPAQGSARRGGGRRGQCLHRRPEHHKDPQGDPRRGDLDPGRRRHLLHRANLELRRRAGRDRGPARVPATGSRWTAPGTSTSQNRAAPRSAR